MNRSIRIAAIVAGLAAVLPGVAACSSTPTTESTGEYVDSAAITAKVKAAILKDPQLKVMQISVETFKDTVQLSGFVDSAATARHAAAVVRNVEGVKAVKNDLVVK
jgi:Predicted periplasmic or secreted lipoprotein